MCYIRTKSAVFLLIGFSDILHAMNTRHTNMIPIIRDSFTHSNNISQLMKLVETVT